MINKVRVIFPIFLTACATSTGVLEIGPDTYNIATTADGYRGGIKAARVNAMKEATAHCKSLGKNFLLTSMKRSRAYLDDAMFDLTFRCLEDDHPDYVAAYGRRSDQIIEHR